MGVGVLAHDTPADAMLVEGQHTKPHGSSRETFSITQTLITQDAKKQPMIPWLTVHVERTILQNAIKEKRNPKG